MNNKLNIEKLQKQVNKILLRKQAKAKDLLEWINCCIVFGNEDELYEQALKDIKDLEQLNKIINELEKEKNEQ